VLLPLIAVGLAVYALVDLASSDEEDRGGIPKGLWVVLIVLLPFVGPIAWILVKRSQRSAPRYGGSGRPGSGSTPPARRRRNVPLAPDDDPEFLWRLEQQQRRQGNDTSAPGTSGTTDRPDRPAADDAPAYGTGPTPGTEPTPGTDPGSGGPDHGLHDDAADPERDEDTGQSGTGPERDGPGSR